MAKKIGFGRGPSHLWGKPLASLEGEPVLMISGREAETRRNRTWVDNECEGRGRKEHGMQAMSGELEIKTVEW